MKNSDLLSLKNKIGFFFLFILAVFSSCKEDDEVIVQSHPIPAPAYAQRTVLVYMAADNSLGEFASKDILEMAEGVKNLDMTKNNLLIFVDRTNAAPCLIRLCHDERHNVVMETPKTYQWSNSVGEEEMREVIMDAFQEYPADSYGLVLWSHGEGWVPAPHPNTRWWGQDNSSNVEMNIPSLHEVLSDAPHLDFILFDACFMQSVEVLYELRDCTDYFIGSPTEIPGPGAPYQKVVPAMFVSGGVVREVAQAYYTYYEDRYDDGIGISNDNWTGGVSVSIVKSEPLDLLAYKTKDILLTYMKSSVSTSGIMYYNRWHSSYYYDMDGFIRKITGENNDYAVWKEAFDNAVVSWKTTDMNFSMYLPSYDCMFSMDGSAGLSIYIYKNINSSTNIFYRSLAWYNDVGWDSVWKEK